MNQDEILQSTRSVVQSLETLKNEHTNMINTFVDKLDAFKNDAQSTHIIEEEISILKNSDEMVHLGISEASVLIQLSNYLQTVEAEKQKIKSQVKRLCQENAWLRDELAAAQKKLQESEQNAAQIEVELSHLKFLKELKKFDDDLTTQQQQQPQHSHPQSNDPNSDNRAKDPIFPDDDEDQGQSNSKYLIL
jgi:kinesin light chain